MYDVIFLVCIWKMITVRKMMFKDVLWVIIDGKFDI